MAACIKVTAQDRIATVTMDRQQVNAQNTAFHPSHVMTGLCAATHDFGAFPYRQSF